MKIQILQSPIAREENVLNCYRYGKEKDWKRWQFNYLEGVLDKFGDMEGKIRE